MKTENSHHLASPPGCPGPLSERSHGRLLAPAEPASGGAGGAAPAVPTGPASAHGRRPSACERVGLGVRGDEGSPSGPPDCGFWAPAAFLPWTHPPPSPPPSPRSPLPTAPHPAPGRAGRERRGASAAACEGPGLRGSAGFPRAEPGVASRAPGRSSPAVRGRARGRRAGRYHPRVRGVPGGREGFPEAPSDRAGGGMRSVRDGVGDGREGLRLAVPAVSPLLYLVIFI